MVIEPSYLWVAEPDRELSFTAARRSDRRQLVRVWAREHWSKISTISEFRQFELQPADGQSLTQNIPSLNRPCFLAISVFSNDGTQWLRSSTMRSGPFDIPQMELGFVDANTMVENQGGHPHIVLSIVYV